MPDKYRMTLAERTALLGHLKWILECDTELELMKVMRKYGIMDEDPRFSRAVQIFRDLRSGKL
jgi:hypothetical protein